MADDSEKIAMIIETQAQLSGLRQAAAGVSDLTGQVKTAAGQMQNDLGTATAALNSLGIRARVVGGNIAVAARDMANADNILRNLGSSAKTVDAALKQAASSSAGLGASTRAVADAQDAMSPRLRSSALAASRLTLALDGMGSGMQGVARSIGTLSYGLSDLGGAGFAAMASGIAAGAIALATLGDLLYKDAQRATALGEAFKEHLANEKFDALTTSLRGVQAETAKTEARVLTLGERFQLLGEVGLGAFADPSAGFLTNLRHELTLTTQADDDHQKTLAAGEEITKARVAAIKELTAATMTLNDEYAREVGTSAFRAQELQYQIQGNTFASERVALVQQESNAVEEINKKYADQAKLRGGPLTANEVAQQQIEIANAQQLLTLGLRLNDVQKARADAQKAQALADATAKVRAAGAGATSDIDGPSATYNKRLLDIDKEYEDATVKQHVDSTVAKQTRDAEYARAYRDMLKGLSDAEAKQQEATSRVLQSGISAGSDLEGPYARYQAARVKDARDAEEQIRKEHVETSIANTAQLAKDARAERDYYETVRQAQTEYYAELAAARGDTNSDAVFYQESMEIEQKLHDQVMNHLISEDQERALLHARELTRAKDQARTALDQLRSSSEAAEAYGGKLGAIGKAVNSAIRAGEIAANAVKDFGRGKSEAAEAIAAAARFDYVGAALHGAASVGFFGAAAFESAEAIGSLAGGGGGGSGSGGGSASTPSSTFTPNDNSNGNGSQQIIINTVNPFSNDVIAKTIYYLDRAQVLKIPGAMPAAPGGYQVTHNPILTSR